MWSLELTDFRFCFRYAPNVKRLSNVIPMYFIYVADGVILLLNMTVVQSKIRNGKVARMWVGLINLNFPTVYPYCNCSIYILYHIVWCPVATNWFQPLWTVNVIGKIFWCGVREISIARACDHQAHLFCHRTCRLVRVAYRRDARMIQWILYLFTILYFSTCRLLLYRIYNWASIFKSLFSKFCKRPMFGFRLLI